MDLSKMPKFSQTPPPPDSSSPPANPSSNLSPNPAPNAPPPQGIPVMVAPRLAEAWFSIAIGVIVLFLFPHTFQYIRNPTTFQQNNPVTDSQGNTIPYAQSEIFWADLGMTVFGVALLIEGIALIVALRRRVIFGVLFLTAGAGLFNLYVVIRTYDVIGFQVFCAVAVAISGYMALSQWSIARLLAAGKK
jgi:hypothetical protein